jgi:ppGpp synthetase/RelA/SpoT-type nucleotidyltranferase
MFSDAQEEFRSLESLFQHALEVESARLKFALDGVPETIVRTEFRLKEFEKIRENYIEHNGEPHHETLFQDIIESCTDLIGLRVITLYNADLETIEDKIVHALGLEKRQQIFNERDLRKGSKFGYRATHWKYAISDEFVTRQTSNVQITVELQIRSVLSDAWARHSHSLLYKSSDDPSDKLIREFASASATIEGLDNQIDALFASAGTSSRRSYLDDSARTDLASAIGGIIGENISDAKVDSLVAQLRFESSMPGENFEALISDAKRAWSKYGGRDFQLVGGNAPDQKLKIALFGIDKDKYACLISPHLRRRTTDLLASL